MRIIRNEAMIKRNARIAQFTMLAGLLVLGAGMFISFRYQDQFGLSLAALLIGFMLSQIGIYYSNRWGRRPRPDELLDQALKGLDDKFTLYHYHSPVPHLLVGPAGIWILQPYHQRGKISFSKGRWRQKGGNLYLKIFAQEGIGRPDLEISGAKLSLQKALYKKLPEEFELPEIKVALVFTHPKAEIEISEEERPPAETVQMGKLKELIRKAAKAKALSQAKAEAINEVLLS